MSTHPPGVPDDLRLDVTLPPVARAGQRSRAALLQIPAILDVDHAERYRYRDVDNVPGKESFCNFFFRDAMKLLDVPVPLMLANELADYLTKRWSVVDAWVAQLAADQGFPVGGVYKNPLGGHGHIVVVMPTDVLDELRRMRTAQAGLVNFRYGTAEQSFPGLTPTWIVHQ